MQNIIFIVIVVPIFLLVIFIKLIIGFVNLLSKKDTSDKHNTTYTHSSIRRITDATDTRCIYGKPLATDDDWTRWWVLRGFSDAITTRLSELEKEIRSKTCIDALHKKQEWERFYRKYRMLCINHGIWNMLIDERSRFVPTESQINKENGLYNRIDRSYQYGEHERSLYAIERAVYEAQCCEILNYINSQSNKITVRYIMLNDLSQGDNDKKSLYLQTCKQMTNEGILSENRDSHGKITIKMKRKSKRQHIEDEQKGQPPSVFHQSLYALVTAQDEYKVLYTVGEPQKLDRISNTCEFISESRGEKYYTSLEKCSCLVYQSSQISPCKHMLTLAKRLGYYHSKWIQ